MNPMKWHPMKMDKMIFELNPSVHATSLYLIVCSFLDEGQTPTINQVLQAWNGTEDDLARAVSELCDLRILKPMDLMHNDRELLLNQRENWAWCRAATQCLKKAM
ncbi:MAG: hypothetical protein AB9866_00330 [Syntrophobacteraceae bacterium]